MAKSKGGRQKVEMKKMSKQSNLMVTFSKRRSGLFKKASELSILCGLHLALIVYSPGKKIFSFGNPSVESILKRFLDGNPTLENPNISRLVEANREVSVSELNMELNQVLKQLDDEKQREEKLAERKKTRKDKRLWEAPVEELGLEELGHLKMAMEDLKKNVVRQIEVRKLMESTNVPPFDPNASTSGVGYVAASVDHMALHGYNLGFGHI